MTKRTPKLKFTQDKRGLWRWSLIAANGKCLADSGEGYATRANVGRAFLATLKAAQQAQPLAERVAEPKAPKPASGKLRGSQPVETSRKKVSK